MYLMKEILTNTYTCTIRALLNTVSVCLSVCLQEAKEHFEMIKEDYQKQLQKLTKLVDEAVDPVDFMKASGELVLLVYEIVLIS